MKTDILEAPKPAFFAKHSPFADLSAFGVHFDRHWEPTEIRAWTTAKKYRAWNRVGLKLDRSKRHRAIYHDPFCNSCSARDCVRLGNFSLTSRVLRALENPRRVSRRLVNYSRQEILLSRYAARGVALVFTALIRAASAATHTCAGVTSLALCQ